MEVGNSVADSELPNLKGLANELLTAEAPALALLDQIASLAAAIAARSREEARRQLLDGLAEAAAAIVPSAVDDLQRRLGHASLDELSGLRVLLDKAAAARVAFEHADAGLMAARDRGDYAAMAPLALEAGNQKSALDAASAEIARQFEIDATAMPAADDSDAEPADEPVRLLLADDEATTFRPAEAEISAVLAPPESVTGAPAARDLPEGRGEEPQSDLPEAQAERRRLRGLIRQMRGTMDEPA